MSGPGFSISRLLRAPSGVRGYIYAGTIALAVAMIVWFGTRPAIPETSVDENGRYHLIGADGKLVDRASFKGQPYLVVFGYTARPDKSAAMILRLAKARAALGNAARAIPIVMISVDPERDRPDVLAAYTARFPGPVIGLTGNSDVIASVADHAAVYARRIVNPDGTYTIEHTGSAIVYDRNDQFHDAILPDDTLAQIETTLREVIDVPANSATSGRIAFTPTDRH